MPRVTLFAVVSLSVLLASSGVANAIIPTGAPTPTTTSAPTETPTPTATVGVTVSPSPIPTSTPTAAPACLARFAATIDPGNPANGPFLVWFDASDSVAPLPIVSYTWNFGDGSSGSGQSAAHLYADEGLYEVTLTISDGGTCVSTSTMTVAIWGPTPSPTPTIAGCEDTHAMIDFEKYTPLGVPQIVSFDGSGSTSAGTIVSWSWDFGDGSSTTGTVSTHLYDYAGFYFPSLTIVDDLGCTDTVSVQLDIPLVGTPSPTPTSGPGTPTATATATATATPTATPTAIGGVDLVISGYTREEEDEFVDSIGLIVNDDDDNGNAVADQDENGPVTGEDEPIRLELTLPSTGDAEFYIDIHPDSHANVRFWLDQQKTTELILDDVGQENPPYDRKKVTWSRPSETVPQYVWVEGIDLGNGTDSPVFTLGLKIVGGAEDLAHLKLERIAFMAEDVQGAKKKEILELLNKEPAECAWADKVKAISKDRAWARSGVMISHGDSNSAVDYYNPDYDGMSDFEKAGRNATHYGDNNDKDGWWLVRTEIRLGKRTHTAAGGMPMWSAAAPKLNMAGSGDFLQGYIDLSGKTILPRVLNISLTYKPEISVILLGTNDANRNPQTTVADFKKNLEQAVKDLLQNKVIPILIAPQSIFKGAGPYDMTNEYKRIRELNQVVRDVACAEKLPYVDFENLMNAMYEKDQKKAPDNLGQIKARYFQEDGIHLNQRQLGGRGADGKNSASHFNLSRNGQLLHSWMALGKVSIVLDVLGRL